MLSSRCRPIQGKRPPILLSLDGEADQTPRFASRKVPSFLRKSTFELKTTKSGIRMLDLEESLLFLSPSSETR